MSEPIELYNQEGELVILAGPKYAQEQLDAGNLFDAPPLVVEEEVAPPPKKVVTKRSRATKKE